MSTRPRIIDRLNAERTIDLRRYQADGFDDRYTYLCALADEHDVPFDTLLAILDFMPPTEDFDGLVTTLEDFKFLHNGGLTG